MPQGKVFDHPLLYSHIRENIGSESHMGVFSIKYKFPFYPYDRKTVELVIMVRREM